MLNLIIPKTLLHFIDINRGSRSRASYILKCVDYIKNNLITITNEGTVDDKFEGFKSRGENSSHNKM